MNELIYNFKNYGSKGVDRSGHEGLDEEGYISNSYYFFGLLIYIIIFIGIIPYIIFKNKWYGFLEIYFINVDLLASVVSFRGGPFNSNIFKYLYNNTDPLIGYISNNIINLFVLLGIAFVIINLSIQKSIVYGMSVSFFIYIITYLFPSRFINNFMIYIYIYFNENFSVFLKKYFNFDTKIISTLIWFIVFIIGFVFALLFILFERFCIKYFVKDIAYLIDKIINKL